MTKLLPWAATALVAALVALPSAAPAEIQPLLGVNVSRGFIDLGMIAPRDSSVTFYEEINGERQELGTAMVAVRTAEDTDGLASIPAIPWNCQRNIRVFIARAHTPDGRDIELFKEARTPDCRDRVLVQAPSRVEPGSRVSIALKDRWQIGDFNARLCIARTGVERSCKSLKFWPGQKTLTVKRDAGNKIALIDIDLIIGGTHHHQKMGVGRNAPAGGRAVALVTGDSMMEGIDTILAQQLKKNYRVIGQTRPGTGVSKQLDTPWTSLARSQAAKHKPAVSIVMVGGNEGYPMKTAAGDEVKCCGAPWQAEYTSRITSMATSYARDGRGTVIWALLPPPKRSDLVEQMDAVNASIRAMATAVPGVQLVPLDEIFGPKYRDTINGKQVRDPDGLHFNLAGQRIAAKAIIDALRKASVTTPGVS